jgi:hypothetical protein
MPLAIVAWSGSCKARPAGHLAKLLCTGILAWNTSGCIGLTKYSWMSFDCSLYLLMPRKLNIPLLLFPDFGMRFLDQELRLLYYGVLIPSFGHFRHIQGQAQFGLFQPYPTSLAYHSSSQVAKLQEISCWL